MSLGQDVLLDQAKGQGDERDDITERVKVNDNGHDITSHIIKMFR